MYFFIIIHWLTKNINLDPLLLLNFFNYYQTNISDFQNHYNQSYLLNKMKNLDIFQNLNYYFLFISHCFNYIHYDSIIYIIIILSFLMNFNIYRCYHHGPHLIIILIIVFILQSFHQLFFMLQFL